MITELKLSEVLVCGTNIHGMHGGGAAAQAYRDFDLPWGMGEGLYGNTYAFPTLNTKMEQYTHKELESIRDAFYRCCEAHPDLIFLLTPVGTGIANYPSEYIESLFVSLPGNVKKVGW